MDYPSFVGSEAISELISCTLLDLFFSPLSSCIFYCCLMEKIYINYMAVPVSPLALLLCSLYWQNQHILEQDPGTTQSMDGSAATVSASPASHLATEDALFSIPHSGDLQIGHRKLVFHLVSLFMIREFIAVSYLINAYFLTGHINTAKNANNCIERNQDDLSLFCLIVI